MTGVRVWAILVRPGDRVEVGGEWLTVTAVVKTDDRSPKLTGLALEDGRTIPVRAADPIIRQTQEEQP